MNCVLRRDTERNLWSMRVDRRGPLTTAVILEENWKANLAAYIRLGDDAKLRLRWLKGLTKALEAHGMAEILQLHTLQELHANFHCPKLFRRCSPIPIQKVHETLHILGLFVACRRWQRFSWELQELFPMEPSLRELAQRVWQWQRMQCRDLSSCAAKP